MSSANPCRLGSTTRTVLSPRCAGTSNAALPSALSSRPSRTTQEKCSPPTIAKKSVAEVFDRGKATAPPCNSTKPAINDTTSIEEVVQPNCMLCRSSGAGPKESQATSTWSSCAICFILSGRGREIPANHFRTVSTETVVPNFALSSRASQVSLPWFPPPLAFSASHASANRSANRCPSSDTDTHAPPLFATAHQTIR